MEKRKLDIEEDNPLKDYLDEIIGSLESQEKVEFPTYDFHLEEDEKKEDE